MPTVLESALDTFARHGYSRTSMEDVARNARISRPGLYLYFSSKQALLQAAVEYALARDVERAESLLADQRTPLRARLLEALDQWTGQYVGPLAADVDGLLEHDASLLGDLPRVYSARFGAALARALHSAADGNVREVVHTPRDADMIRDVILALVAGLKRQAATREEFRQRLSDGLGLLLP